MKTDSLLYFDKPDDFREYLKELDIYNGWRLQSGSNNDRGKAIEGRSYTRKLRDLFREKNFYHRQVSLPEIVSWLDNMVLMKRLLDELERTMDYDAFDELEISCEYMIRMSKKMRVDYILLYRDKMLLIEYRMVNTFEKLRPTWERKFSELLCYKELMSNYIQNKTIRLYGFIGMFEQDYKISKPKHIEYNRNQVQYLARYVNQFLIE